MPSRKFPPPPITLIPLAVRKKQKTRPPAPPATAKAKPPLATPHDQIVNDAWADLAAALEQGDGPEQPHNADPWKRSPSRRNSRGELSSQGKKQPGA